MMPDDASSCSASGFRSRAPAGSATALSGRRRSAGRWLAVVLTLWPCGTGSLLAQRSAYEELQTFSGVVNHIRMNYVDSVSYSHLIRAAVDGMLRSLDPHSHFDPARNTRSSVRSRGGCLGRLGFRWRRLTVPPPFWPSPREAPPQRPASCLATGS